MNYTLTLNLEGFSEAENSIDSLLSKIGGLNGPKIPFEQWLSTGGESEKAGESIGKGIKEGIKKNLKGNWLGLTGEWGEAVAKAQRDAAKSLKENQPTNFKKYGMSDLPKMGFTTPQFPDFKFQEFKPQIDKLKVVFAGIATLFNPFVGARLLSDLVPKDKMSGGKGVTGAIFGAAGAAGYGEIFVVVKVLETAFKLLSKAVMNTVAAYETARQIYAKSLMQGLGVNFTVKRGMIASVLGVSETEVLRFGQAMNYLNPKLAFAADTLARTAVPLTGVGWEFKILEQNIAALWATIASGLAPAIGAIIEDFNSFLVTLGKTDILKSVAQELGVVLIVLNDLAGGFEVAVNAFVVGFKIIADSISIAIMSMLNLLSKIPGLNSIGGWDTGKAKQDIIDQSTNLRKEISDVSKNLFGKSTTGIPQPMAQMKQLVASDWEKHGLNIAGTQQSTNDLIKKGNGYLKIISDHITGRGQVPRATQFGMNPTVSNP